MSDSWKTTHIDDWSCQELQDWIVTVKLGSRNQNKVIASIKDSEITGEDFNTMDTKKDILESFPNINAMSGNKIFSALKRARNNKNVKKAPHNYNANDVSSRAHTNLVNQMKHIDDWTYNELCEWMCSLRGVSERNRKGVTKVILTDQISGKDFNSSVTEMQDVREAFPLISDNGVSDNGVKNIYIGLQQLRQTQHMYQIHPTISNDPPINTASAVVHDNDQSLQYEYEEESINKNINMLINDKEEEIKKKENTITKHEKTIQKLQNENETLRNNENATQQMNLKQQTQINELKKHIDSIQNELNTTKQSNLRQQKAILELKNVRKEEDEKQKDLSKILIDLENEMKIFKQNYNKNKLNKVFCDSPTELIQNNSNINTNINKYNKDNKSIILLCESFSDYINNLQLFIKQVSIPNVNKYKTWNLEQMCAWIMSLDNGKYVEYIKQLRNGFLKSQMLSGDLLPELTRSDLSNSPFNIDEFIIKRDLEKHFKSLVQSNIIPYNQNEGKQTQYIDK